MRRFFVPAEALVTDPVILPQDTTHHIRKVLRLAIGESIILLDGQGTLCACTLIESAGGGLAATVDRRVKETDTALPIDLYQGLPKFDKMELILQKGTELGIRRFVPVISERTEERKPVDRVAKRMPRWQTILREAARQSRRLFLPQLEAATSFDAIVSSCDAQLKLILWEDSTRALDSALSTTPPAEIALLVGPEGGFSPGEVARARAAGFIDVGCGPRILRTETAGFTMAAILQYLYGDLRQPPRQDKTAPLESGK